MFHHQAAITGADLRAFRKAAKLSQAALADRAGVRRETVQYWERKGRVPLRYGAPAAFAKALGLPKDAGFSGHYPRARSWGITDRWQAALDAQAEAALIRLQERQAQRRTRLRVTCGAKTRAGGKCRNKSEPGKRRCKFHGGKSTGAKTPEGRARIAEAQRRRWAAYRAASQIGNGTRLRPAPFLIGGKPSAKPARLKENQANQAAELEACSARAKPE